MTQQKTVTEMTGGDYPRLRDDGRLEHVRGEELCATRDFPATAVRFW